MLKHTIASASDKDRKIEFLLTFVMNVKSNLFTLKMLK